MLVAGSHCFILFHNAVCACTQQDKPAVEPVRGGMGCDSDAHVDDAHNQFLWVVRLVSVRFSLRAARGSSSLDQNHLVLAAAVGRTCVAYDESLFEENVGAITAVLVSTIAIYTCTAASLILLCQNGRQAFTQQSLWPKSWITVVGPLVVAWLFLVLLAASNVIVHCVGKVGHCRKALEKVLADDCRHVATYTNMRITLSRQISLFRLEMNIARKSMNFKSTGFRPLNLS